MLLETYARTGFEWQHTLDAALALSESLPPCERRSEPLSFVQAYANAVLSLLSAPAYASQPLHARALISGCAAIAGNTSTSDGSDDRMRASPALLSLEVCSVAYVLSIVCALVQFFVSLSLSFIRETSARDCCVALLSGTQESTEALHDGGS